MVYLKTQEEIELLRESNRILAGALAEVAKMIVPGVSTAALDRRAEEYIRDNGAIPSCKGYEGYPATLCTSVNEQVVHGIPSERVILEEGDIISVDTCVLKDGFHGDSAYTFAVGEVSAEKRRLMRVTRECLSLGIESALCGRRIGDIGYAIQSHAESSGYQVVREFIGHGIGRDMHEDPEVPNYGRRGNGIVLKPGMVIAIEPMLLSGRRNILIENDGWTARSADRLPACHYELSVAIGRGGADVLSTFEPIRAVLGDRFI